MKERFIENGIEYVRNGDYYIPNLTVPDDKVYNIGKYGRMHAKFIKENRPCFYTAKMIDGTWIAYLEEIDTTAKEMVDSFRGQPLSNRPCFIIYNSSVTKGCKATGARSFISVSPIFGIICVRISCAYRIKVRSFVFG